MKTAACLSEQEKETVLAMKTARAAWEYPVLLTAASQRAPLLGEHLRHGSAVCWSPRGTEENPGLWEGVSGLLLRL